MTESLRDRQKQLTAEAVVVALASFVAETGSFDFSIADIARRAGVSPRTVYNHFGDRQGLFDALSEYAGREMDRSGGTDIPETLHELPGLVGVNFEAMESIADLAEAFARIDYASQPAEERSRRTAAIVELVRKAYPDLTERQGEATAVIIRQMASSTTWYRLTREHGLTAREAGAVAGWTMRLQVAALDRGDHPFVEDAGDAG
jgi:TetR/AcrR family transcriptional regulator, regulator of autoinduction and epiphytic fitness